MLFGRKEELQQLNLKPPAAAAPQPEPASATMQPIPIPHIDPSKLASIQRMARDILHARRIPEWLFVCQVNKNLLMVNPGDDQGLVMLLFSNPSAAADYLRATGVSGTVGQIRTDTLPQLMQHWLAAGVRAAAFDRCPRCPELVSVEMAKAAQWTKQDFATIWAHHHATRLVCGESRIRAAMDHIHTRDLAAARTNLEYVRDHFECGIPYLHQMIGLIAGMQGDDAANAAATERLKEFGSPFDGPLEFSVELLSTAMMGLLMNFGILPPDKNAASTVSESSTASDQQGTI